jgi:xylan 1,4-beta-xylosidase
MYSSYTAASFARKHDLERKHGVNLEGALTWAFEFEDQPYFAGFRELASNSLDKPVLNAFRMFGLMRGQRVEVKSSASLDTDRVLREGVRTEPDIRAIATRNDNDREVDVLVWNYHDDDVAAQPASIELSISGLPSEMSHALVEHFRIDADHSNAFTAWKRMGSPQHPTPEQYKQLESAGHLQLLTSPEWIGTNGASNLQFELPRQALSLIRIRW